jgi:hypothetical protein
VLPGLPEVLLLQLLACALDREALAEFYLPVLRSLSPVVALLHPRPLLPGGGGCEAGGGLHHQLAPQARREGHVAVGRPHLPCRGQSRIGPPLLHPPSTVRLPIGIVSQMFISCKYKCCQSSVHLQVCVT